MSRARKCRQVQVGQERLGGSCYVTAILVVVAAVAAALYGLNGTDLPSTATPGIAACAHGAFFCTVLIDSE